MLMKHYAPTDVKQALKHGSSGGSGLGGGGSQGKCEWRSKVFLKNQKKKKFFGGGAGGGGRWGSG